MAPAPPPPASTAEWLRGGLANFILAVAWLSAPGLLLGSMAALAWSAGYPLGAAIVVLYVLLTLAQNGASRACVTVAITAVAALIATPVALSAAALTAALAALISVGVPSRHEATMNLIADRLCVQSFFTRCELRGALESMREEKSVYAFHPHGILCIGFSLNGPWSRRFLKHCGPVRFLIDGNLRYKNPFFRILLDLYQSATVGFADAGRDTVRKLMATGTNIAIVPGGFHEATLFRYGEDRVVIRQRKGLVKLCLQHGYRLYPIYSFGESETFYAWQGLKGLRLWLAKYNIPTVVFFGVPWCPILPRYQADIVTFVGEPLELPHIPEPTEKDVEEWHGKYLAAVEALFEAKKAEAGRPDAKLQLL